MPANEYDSYAPRLLDLLNRGCEPRDLARHLSQLEGDAMGLSPSPPARPLRVAHALQGAVLEALSVRDATEPRALIDNALARGARDGLDALSPIERRVFLISEAEVLCDMEGIDSFLDTNSVDTVGALVEAFTWVGARRISSALQEVVRLLPERDGALLDQANTLITARKGYSYDSILWAVTRWVGAG